MLCVFLSVFIFLFALFCFVLFYSTLLTLRFVIAPRACTLQHSVFFVFSSCCCCCFYSSSSSSSTFSSFSVLLFFSYISSFSFFRPLLVVVLLMSSSCKTPQSYRDGEMCSNVNDTKHKKVPSSLEAVAFRLRVWCTVGVLL